MDLRPFIYGGISSMFAELCTFPIDTTKTRLQIQGELCNNNIKHFKGGKYNGMLHAIQLITKHEGVSALYRGLNAALIRQASYGTLKIGMYQKLKVYTGKKSKEERLMNNIFCAVTAGVTSSAIANPIDIIKIRLQAKSNYNQMNSSFFQEFSTTVSKEGILGLYKAVIPTAARAAILVGVLLPSYDYIKHIFIREGVLEDDMPCHLVSSFLAATLATSVSCPVEVIRTRLMNQTIATASGSHVPIISFKYFQYQNFFQCLKMTVKNERIVALWKGFVPTWYRIGPWNVIFFLCYEKIKKLDRLFFTQ